MRLHLLLLSSLLASTAPAAAFNVQEMAAERVKEKMGTIRGTIAPTDTNVRLTVELIDRWRPITSPSAHSAPKELPLDPIHTGETEPAVKLPKDADMRSIMDAVDNMIADSPDS
ncbi:MAG: hypothetical protein AAGF29_10020 [Pseudomonadota bacterium]